MIKMKTVKYVNQLRPEDIENMMQSLQDNGYTLQERMDFVESKVTDVTDALPDTGYRLCSKCNELFTEGFVHDTTFYCSEDCLHKDFTPEQWLAEYEESEECGDNGGDYYAMWTQFWT